MTSRGSLTELLKRLTTHDGRLALALLAAFAVVLRLALIVAVPIGTEADIQARVGDEKYFVQLGHSIAEKGEFSEQYLKAYRPPMFPAVISLHMLATDNALRALQVTQNLLFLAMFALVLSFVRRRFGWAAASIALLLLLFSPLWLTLPQTAYSESFFSVLLVGAFVLAHDVIERRRLRDAALFGIVAGFAALTREVALPATFALLPLMAAHMFSRAGAGQAAVVLLTAVLALTATIGPWTARNYGVFGRFVPIATNGPINFYMGNNPTATSDYHWALPAGAAPLWNTPSERGENELKVAGMALSGGLDFIRSNPAHAAQLAATKAVRFWLPVFPQPGERGAKLMARLVMDAVELTMTIGAFAGFWIWRRSFTAQAALLIVGTAWAMHIATYVNFRYRAPFEPLLAIVAGAALAAWLAHVTKNARIDPARVMAFGGPPSAGALAAHGPLIAQAPTDRPLRER